MAKLALRLLDSVIEQGLDAGSRMCQEPGGQADDAAAAQACEDKVSSNSPSDSSESGCDDTEVGSNDAACSSAEAPTIRQALAGASPLQPVADPSDCTLPAATVQMSSAATMSWINYQEACKQERLCNAQLVADGASTDELAAYPAKLPAADALALFPVFEGQLLGRWDCPTVRGILQLPLQAGVGQQLLDAVVKAVYARRLPVEGGGAEDLLLLADFLQASWLTRGVRQYLLQHVLPQSPVAVCDLMQRFPGLDLTGAVKDRILQQCQPHELLALIRATPECERLHILGVAARRGTGAQCLEVLCRLLDAGVRLSAAELRAIFSHRPELAAALVDRPVAEAEVNYTALWGEHYASYHEAAASGEPGTERGALVWRVPLHKLRERGERCSATHLQTPDGRRFELRATRRSGDAGEGPKLGLFVHCAGKTRWIVGDRFTISAVRAPGSKRLLVPVPPEDVHKHLTGFGLDTLASQWAASADPELTICRGKYLPVMLQWGDTTASGPEAEAVTA